MSDRVRLAFDEHPSRPPGHAGSPARTTHLVLLRVIRSHRVRSRSCRVAVGQGARSDPVSRQAVAGSGVDVRPADSAFDCTVERDSPQSGDDRDRPHRSVLSTCSRGRGRLAFQHARRSNETRSTGAVTGRARLPATRTRRVPRGLPPRRSTSQSRVALMASAPSSAASTGIHATLVSFPSPPGVSASHVIP